MLTQESLSSLERLVEKDTMVLFRPTSIPISDEACEKVNELLKEDMNDSLFERMFIYLRGLR